MSAPAAPTLDPVTFEVIRSSFDYACARMSTVLKRASFSSILYEMTDFSNAIFDQNGDLVAQAANCPSHLGAMHFSAQAALDKWGHDFGPGDVVILNDPYEGGTHTPDVTLIMPIFFEDERIGFGVSRAHWQDVGGGAGGGQSFGTHVAAEGLRLPPVKLMRGGEFCDDVLSIIRNATRVPQNVDGDLTAQFGALRAAETELQRLAGRYGVAVLREAMAAVMDYTERMTRAAIAELPDGEYHGEDVADTDGVSASPFYARVKVVVDGDRIIVDFDGSDPMAAGAINSPFANTASAVYYALKFFLAPDSPANAGMYRAIEIKVPPRTWLNAEWPAPTIGCTTLAIGKAAGAIWLALAKAIPEQINAVSYADGNWFVASVTEQDSPFVHIISDLPSGGWGGTPFNDGMSATIYEGGNCTNLSAESAEMLFPIEYEAFDLLEDSAGPGRFRGGLGSRLKIRWNGRTELSMECSRTIEGSPGVNGGASSPPQRQLKVDAEEVQTVIGGHDGDRWLNPLLSNVLFTPGESFLFESTGGGGWGDPMARPATDVLEDVLDGYVSLDNAAELYGVIIDAKTMQVDEAATADRRHP
jgi:N-methylhydantoinase B